MNIPGINGLLNYHIEGDDALLYLGRDRYERAGMGAEIHPSNPDHLSQILKVLPNGRSSTVHLPYSVALDHDDTDIIRDFVFAGGSEISGYVLHDTMLYREDLDKGLEYIKKLSGKLQGKSDGVVYVEYAVGLPFEVYYDLAQKIKDLPNIGVCIDIGHLAINATVADFYKKHPSIYVRDLKPDSDMSMETYHKIDESVCNGRRDSFSIIEALCKVGASVHFHLHDGHPMSTFSPYGVCDHLPFFWEIPTFLPEVGSIGGIYGILGLRRVLEIALGNISDEKLTFTLEIHPQPGQKELDIELLQYFSNWTDLTNAKSMNFWMDLVIQNAMIFKELCEDIVGER